MSKYLLSVILSSISIGLCDILVPKHNGIDKLVKFIGMLIILIVSIVVILVYMLGYPTFEVNTQKILYGFLLGTVPALFVNMLL